MISQARTQKRRPALNNASLVRTMGATGSMGSAAPKAPEIHHSGKVQTGTPLQGAEGSRGSGRLDFAAINVAALRDLPALLMRWLPDGRLNGHEYEARNPRRLDRHPGSFRVNMRTGRWSDFAIGVVGGDPISLAAYLFSLPQSEAGRRLADMLRVV